MKLPMNGQKKDVREVKMPEATYELLSKLTSQIEIFYFEHFDEVSDSRKQMPDLVRKQKLKPIRTFID